MEQAKVIKKVGIAIMSDGRLVLENFPASYHESVRLLTEAMIAVGRFFIERAAAGEATGDGSLRKTSIARPGSGLIVPTLVPPKKLR